MGAVNTANAASTRFHASSVGMVPAFHRFQEVWASSAPRQRRAIDIPRRRNSCSISLMREVTSMYASICSASKSVNNDHNASNFNALHNIAMQPDIRIDDAEEIVAWIEQILRHKSMKAAQLAKEAKVPQSVLSRILNGETRYPSRETLAALAASSPIAVPRSVQLKLDQTATSTRDALANQITRNSSGRIPIWGIHPIQRDGEFRLNAVPVNSLRAPAMGEGSLKLAAFYAPDETMSPRWNAGEPVVFDLARPATNGDIAVIKLLNQAEPNADETYLFRRIIRRSDGLLHLEDMQENFSSIPLDRVLEVRHVLNWSDLLA
jgi:transcriptional regulator with XRE-family HTH domain